MCAEGSGRQWRRQDIAQELPDKWKHSGSWEFIDLNRDGAAGRARVGFLPRAAIVAERNLAIRPGNGRGDLTEKHVLWTYDRSVPQVSSPLLYKGVLYTVKDGGILTALDPERGTV